MHWCVCLNLNLGSGLVKWITAFKWSFLSSDCKGRLHNLTLWIPKISWIPPRKTTGKWRKQVKKTSLTQFRGDSQYQEHRDIAPETNSGKIQHSPCVNKSTPVSLRHIWGQETFVAAERWISMFPLWSLVQVCNAKLRSAGHHTVTRRKQMMLIISPTFICLQQERGIQLPKHRQPCHLRCTRVYIYVMWLDMV